MADKCSVAGCGRSSKTRGFCGMHYHRLVRHGKPEIRLNKPSGGACSVSGCNRVSEKKLWCGMCQMHYRRSKTHGTTDPRPPAIKPLCVVKECGRVSLTRGMCIPHYQRWKKYGHTDTVRQLHHGTRTATYSIWQGMKSRCLNPNNSRFKDYGGRGITMCERWLASYANFVADMGQRPSPKHSIDRFPDKNGNYEPGNCRWATAKEQQNNTRANVYVQFQGKQQSLEAWSMETGLKKGTISTRLERGWEVQEALTLPASKVKRSSPKRMEI